MRNQSEPEQLHGMARQSKNHGEIVFFVTKTQTLDVFCSTSQDPEPGNRERGVCVYFVQGWTAQRVLGNELTREGLNLK